MGEKYTVSRELGKKAKPKDDVTFTEEEVGSILDITPQVEGVEEVHVNSRFYWLNAFTGEAKQGIALKSDFPFQLQKLEEATEKVAVGFCVLDDGTIQILMEE